MKIISFNGNHAFVREMMVGFYIYGNELVILLRGNHTQYIKFQTNVEAQEAFEHLVYQENNA